ADVGVEAAVLAAGGLHHVAPRGAGVADGPGGVAQRGERDPVGLRPRERMGLRQDDAHGVAMELVAVDAGQPRVWLLLPLGGPYKGDAAPGGVGQGLPRARPP